MYVILISLLRQEEQTQGFFNSCVQWGQVSVGIGECHMYMHQELVMIVLPKLFLAQYTKESICCNNIYICNNVILLRKLYGNMFLMSAGTVYFRLVHFDNSLLYVDLLKLLHHVICYCDCSDHLTYFSIQEHRCTGIKDGMKLFELP